MLRAASVVQRRVHGFGALGSGSLITPPYRLTGAARISIGARTIIGPYAFLSVLGERLGERYDGKLRIGDDTSVGQNFIVSCAGSTVIGSRVLISSNVHVGDTLHRYDDPERAVIDQPMTHGYVIIADDAFIGMNAVILPNVRVGRHAVVGAGAVVTHDIPDFCVAAGNPARLIRRYDFERRVWLRTDEHARHDHAPHAGPDRMPSPDEAADHDRSEVRRAA